MPGKHICPSLRYGVPRSTFVPGHLRKSGAPSSEEVTAALDRVWLKEGIRPKHLIVDQGSMFKCDHIYDTWREACDILPLFGAV